MTMRLAVVALAGLQLIAVAGCSGAAESSSSASTPPAAVSPVGGSSGTGRGDARGLPAGHEAALVVTTPPTTATSIAWGVGHGHERDSRAPTEPDSEPELEQPMVALTTVDPGPDGLPGEASPASSLGGSAGAGAVRETPSVWALVLAGASVPGDPLLAEAIADAEGLGYEVGVTNCDQGAAQALGMNPATTYTVSLHFETEASARDALEDLEAAGGAGELAQVLSECPA